MSNLNHLLFTTKKIGSNSLYWYSQKALNPLFFVARGDETLESSI